MTKNTLPTTRMEMNLGGKTFSLETGKYAHQANASLIAQYGDTVVLATAVMAKEPRDGQDYFPLMVEYEEKLYAAGKIKGSRFIKREGRPSDDQVLTSRMIDRAIRPLFDKSMKQDVQVICSVLSFDGENDPDVVALFAASAVLAISDIPWEGPLGGVRVGRVNGEYIVNPTYEQRKESDLDAVVSGPKDKVIMLEVGGQEIPEDDMYKAIEVATNTFAEQITFIEKFVKKAGKQKFYFTAKPSEEDEEVSLKEEEKEQLKQMAHDFVEERINTCMFKKDKKSKSERKEMLEALQAEMEAWLKEQQIGKEKRKVCHSVFMDAVEAQVTKAILEKDLRVDCRKLTEVRPLVVEVGDLPRTHGSGMFMRGETQVLSVVTLGSPSDEQTIEGIEHDDEKKWYMHHYNFPPFSVGEARPLRSPGRREIGHGALAEKALEPVLPSREEFPYTIRVVSEVFGSNGSSSMASTCGSSLALMDAGVPIKATVAGIAMGLASTDDGQYKVLTDLQDVEDGNGGMDFKITGTRDGITAIQLDTKTKGLSLQIVRETLDQGKDARFEILDAMEAVIPQPRKELSEYAPRITSFKIDPDKIREVIGSGGKVINEIIENTGVAIDIEDDGMIMVTSPDEVASQKAVEWIKNIVREVKAGETFLGKVSRIMDFGAFVDILPNQSGMVHISELDEKRVDKVTDVVNIGDMVAVKVIKIDEKGRINLSMKRVKPEEKKALEHNNG